MVPEDLAAAAWHDQEAYALVDECHCQPAHAVQNPQVS